MESGDNVTGSPLPLHEQNYYETTMILRIQMSEKKKVQCD